MAPVPRVQPNIHREPALAGYLLVLTGSLAGQQFFLPAIGKEIFLGREPSFDVRFDDQQDGMISRRHAAIAARADGVYLRDLGSRFGTTCGGRPVDSRLELRLQDGDSFQLGGGPTVRVHLSENATQHDPTVRVHLPGRAVWPDSDGPYSTVALRRSTALSAADQLSSGDLRSADRLCRAGRMPSLGADPLERPIADVRIGSDDTPNQDLTPGWLGVDAPLEIALGATALVRAVAIRDALQRALVEGALQQENRQLLDAILSSAVSMKLTALAPNDFLVRSLSPALQYVRKSKLTVWEWLVTANQPGNSQILLLTISSLLKVHERRLREALPSRQLRVRVTVQTQPARLLIGTAGLRKLLLHILPTSADFDAFCLDHFRRVFDRFSGGMNRVEKTNLLLAVESASDISTALQQEEPSAFAVHATSCAFAIAGASRARSSEFSLAGSGMHHSAVTPAAPLPIPSVDFPLFAPTSALLQPTPIPPVRQRILVVLGAVALFCLVALLFQRFVR